MKEIKNKSADRKGVLLVGFNSSFGKGIVVRLAREGYNLALLAKTVQREDFLFGEKIKRESGGEVEIKELDVSGDFDLSLTWPIYGLVYSVASPIINKEVSDLEWFCYEEHLRTQLGGVVKITRKLLRDNVSFKRIAVIGSSYTQGSPPSRVADYVAAKYALLGWTRAAAVDLARKGITVNMVSPGVSGLGVSSGMPRLALDLVKEKTPLKRLVSGEDVGGVVNFILSEEARYLTGLNILMDGGISMN